MRRERVAVIANAHKVSMAQAFEAFSELFGKPTAADKARKEALTALRLEHQEAVQAVYRSGNYASHSDRIAALRAEYAEKVRVVLGERQPEKRKAA